VAHSNSSVCLRGRRHYSVEDSFETVAIDHMMVIGAITALQTRPDNTWDDAIIATSPNAFLTTVIRRIGAPVGKERPLRAWCPRLGIAPMTPRTSPIALLAAGGEPAVHLTFYTSCSLDCP
jgi:hypothetical protein